MHRIRGSLPTATIPEDCGSTGHRGSPPPVSEQIYDTRIPGSGWPGASRGDCTSSGRKEGPLFLSEQMFQHGLPSAVSLAWIQHGRIAVNSGRPAPSCSAASGYQPAKSCLCQSAQPSKPPQVFIKKRVPPPISKCTSISASSKPFSSFKTAQNGDEFTFSVCGLATKVRQAALSQHRVPSAFRPVERHRGHAKISQKENAEVTNLDSPVIPVVCRKHIQHGSSRPRYHRKRTNQDE